MEQTKGQLIPDEKECAHFFNISLDMFCIAGIDGYFKHLNPQFQLTLGFSEHELTDRPFLDFVHPDDQQSTLDAVKQLSQGIKVINFENRHLCKDGSYKVLSWQTVPIGSQLYCTARDVTKQKMALEDLTKKAETIAIQGALLDLTREAIVLIDSKGSVLYWNHGAEDLYGIKVKDAVGFNIINMNIITPDTFTQITTELTKSQHWSGEIQFKKSENIEVTTESHWQLTPRLIDKSESILFISTDITEKKKALSLSFRTQRMESIGTLAGGIAHDLNNMLTPIMMSIELLRSKEEDAGRIRILDTMEVCVQRGAGMVAQVLSFARGVDGERREIQTIQLLKDVERIITDTFLKSFKIKNLVSPNLYTILGDQTQIYQVLINVCVNARDAMAKGGTLTVSAENEVLNVDDSRLIETAPPGAYVNISIEDTGVGMSKETLGRIFEPFFTTKDLGKGSGLGLSTSLAIIKSHDGFINVYSEQGFGTRVNIFLPAFANSNRKLKPATVRPELPRGKGEWILVVDDETSILQVACQTLESFGYRVIAATGGAEAIAIYRKEKEKIALVLTDMMMPDVDGPATIREIRKINSKVLVIASSGLKSNLDAAEVKYFLTKPFNAPTLVRTVRTALDKANSST